MENHAAKLALFWLNSLIEVPCALLVSHLEELADGSVFQEVTRHLQRRYQQLHPGCHIREVTSLAAALQWITETFGHSSLPTELSSLGAISRITERHALTITALVTYLKHRLDEIEMIGAKSPGHQLGDAASLLGTSRRWNDTAANRARRMTPTRNRTPSRTHTRTEVASPARFAAARSNAVSTSSAPWAAAAASYSGSQFDSVYRSSSHGGEPAQFASPPRGSVDIDDEGDAGTMDITHFVSAPAHARPFTAGAPGRAGTSAAASGGISSHGRTSAAVPVAAMAVVRVEQAQTQQTSPLQAVADASSGRYDRFEVGVSRPTPRNSDTYDSRPVGAAKGTLGAVERNSRHHTRATGVEASSTPEYMVERGVSKRPFEPSHARAGGAGTDASVPSARVLAQQQGVPGVSSKTAPAHPPQRTTAASRPVVTTIEEKPLTFNHAPARTFPHSPPPPVPAEPKGGDKHSMLLQWIGALGIALSPHIRNAYSARPTPEMSLPDAMADGVLLCEIVAAVETRAGTRIPTMKMKTGTTGANKSEITVLPGVVLPKSGILSLTGATKNIEMALSVLRARPKVPSRYLWSGDELQAGSESTCWGLLEDIHRAYAHLTKTKSKASADAPGATTRTTSMAVTPPRQPTGFIETDGGSLVASEASLASTAHLGHTWSSRDEGLGVSSVGANPKLAIAQRFAPEWLVGGTRAAWTTSASSVSAHRQQHDARVNRPAREPPRAAAPGTTSGVGGNVASQQMRGAEGGSGGETRVSTAAPPSHVFQDTYTASVRAPAPPKGLTHTGRHIAATSSLPLLVEPVPIPADALPFLPATWSASTGRGGGKRPPTIPAPTPQDKSDLLEWLHTLGLAHLAPGSAAPYKHVLDDPFFNGLILVDIMRKMEPESPPLGGAKALKPYGRPKSLGEARANIEASLSMLRTSPLVCSDMLVDMDTARAIVSAGDRPTIPKPYLWCCEELLLGNGDVAWGLCCRIQQLYVWAAMMNVWPRKAPVRQTHVGAGFEDVYPSQAALVALSPLGITKVPASSCSTGAARGVGAPSMVSPGAGRRRQSMADTTVPSDAQQEREVVVWLRTLFSSEDLPLARDAPENHLECYLPVLQDGTLLASIAEVLSGRRVLGITMPAATPAIARGNIQKVVSHLRELPTMGRRTLTLSDVADRLHAGDTLVATHLLYDCLRFYRGEPPARLPPQALSPTSARDVLVVGGGIGSSSASGGGSSSATAAVGVTRPLAYQPHIAAAAPPALPPHAHSQAAPARTTAQVQAAPAHAPGLISQLQQPQQRPSTSLGGVSTVTQSALVTTAPAPATAATTALRSVPVGAEAPAVTAAVSRRDSGADTGMYRAAQEAAAITSWLAAIGIELERPMLLATATDGDKLDEFTDGTLLARIVEGCENLRGLRRGCLVGIEKMPKTGAAKLANFRRALEVLRDNRSMSLDHLWSELALRDGNPRVVRGLLMHIRKAYGFHSDS